MDASFAAAAGTVDLEGLRKVHGDAVAVDGIDLRVGGGEFFSLLGPSGCGKTTTLRMIGGFDEPTDGRILLDGADLAGTPAHKRPINTVFQSYALFPHLTVAQNVEYGLRWRPGVDRAERRRRAAEALELVRLTRLAGRRPVQLSGGEQQRVALARALARRPDAVLLDEPFSSLDASLRTRVREEVHALLAAQGVTTVLVTHDQEEALSLADEVAVLRDGRIVQQGTPAALYDAPVDEDLARFLGAVNVLRADFDADVALTALGPLTLRGGRAALPDGDRSSGAVMVRPEQLHVSPGRPAGSDPGWGVGGEVEQCRYYGHDALLHIRPDTPADADPLIARVIGEEALPAGTRVRVAAHGPVTPLR